MIIKKADSLAGLPEESAFRFYVILWSVYPFHNNLRYDQILDLYTIACF